MTVRRRRWAAIVLQFVWIGIGLVTNWDTYPFVFLLTCSNVIQLILIFVIAVAQWQLSLHDELRAEAEHGALSRASRPRADGVAASDGRRDGFDARFSGRAGLTKPKHRHEYFPNLPEPKGFSHGPPSIVAAKVLATTGDSTS